MGITVLAMIKIAFLVVSLLLVSCCVSARRDQRLLANWGHHEGVHKPESWALEDNVGVFGDFRITRNVTTREGCVMTCKYLIHYDKLEEVIQFVGRDRDQDVSDNQHQTA